MATTISPITRGAEAIEMAQRYSVVISTISTSTQWIQLSQPNPTKSANRKHISPKATRFCKDVAEETGRRAFSFRTMSTISTVVSDIGDEVRNPILIAYIPNNYHSTASNTASASRCPTTRVNQVRARRGYFARPTVGQAQIPPARQIRWWFPFPVSALTRSWLGVERLQGCLAWIQPPM